MRLFIRAAALFSFLAAYSTVSSAFVAEARGNLRSHSRLKETPTIAISQSDPARGFYEKTYNDENKGRQFKRNHDAAPSLGDDARRVVGDTAARVSKLNSEERNHRRVLQLYERAPIPTKEQQQMQEAAGRLDQKYKNPTQEIEVIRHLSGHYQTELNSAVVSRIPFWQQLTGGWDFSFGFSEAKAKNSVAEANRGVRYGLVLQDIRPSTSRTMTAALGADDIGDWDSAPPANTEWTIGPTSDNEISLRKVDLSTSQYIAAMQDYQRENVSFTESIVSYLKVHALPEIRFKGKAKLRSAPTHGSTNLPGAEIAVSQIHDYYAITYLTKSNLTKDGVSHAIRVPIVGTLAFSQKFDEKGKAVETTISGLLVKSGVPNVNIVCNDVTGSFKTESVYVAGAKSVKLVSEGPKGCPVKDGRTRHQGEKYSIEYNMNF